MDYVTLARAADHGSAQARQQLFETLYSELHRLARRQLFQHGGGVTLGATTLLHEAYLDLAGAEGLAFPDKARFMAYAARAMRGLIIDHARHRQAVKRGGRFLFTAIDTAVGEQVAADTGDADRLKAVSDALDALAGHDRPLAELVDLKFFGGLSFVEIATLRGVSERTVQRDWAKARAWLQIQLDDQPTPLDLESP